MSDRGRDGTAKGWSLIEPGEHGFEEDSEYVLRTLTLTKRELRAATQLLKVLIGVEDRGQELSRIVSKAAGADPNLAHTVLAERARQTFENRARRPQFFNSVIFGEPAWDMLLALYVTDQSGARHTVTGLMYLSGVPPTTALRWLDLLAREQLVTRRAHPTDGRVHYVELTDSARCSLDAYFSGIGP